MESGAVASSYYSSTFKNKHLAFPLDHGKYIVRLESGAVGSTTNEIGF
jgi:hypothetical protein